MEQEEKEITTVSEIDTSEVAENNVAGTNEKALVPVSDNTNLSYEAQLVAQIKADSLKDYKGMNSSSKKGWSITLLSIGILILIVGISLAISRANKVVEDGNSIQRITLDVNNQIPTE